MLTSYIVFKVTPLIHFKTIKHSECLFFSFFEDDKQVSLNKMLKVTKI